MLVDVVKHCLFERVLKVTFFQAMLFVYDVPELLDQVIVDFSVYDCQAAVKPVSKQDAYKDVPLTC
jgi:esterase/lipase superfamily enzyme